MARHLDSHPRVRSTTHRRTGWVQFLFSNATDVRSVAGVGDGLVACGIVISLIQAQVWGAFRPVHYYALQGRPEEFRIMDISSGHHNVLGPTCPFDQEAFLAPNFAPVRGIGFDSAPQNAPFPWNNRLTAIPNLHRPTPSILPPGRPRPVPAPHAPPSAGKFGGWCCHPPVPWACGSTSRNCAYGRLSLPASSVGPSVCVLSSWVGPIPKGQVQFDPTVHPALPISSARALSFPSFTTTQVSFTLTHHLYLCLARPSLF